MRASCAFVSIVHALVLVACAPAEITHEAGPQPVVAHEGFVLAPTVGHLPLPSSFLGVVVTPNQIEIMSGPGGPLTMILDDPEGLASRKPGVIDELMDPLEQAFVAEGPTDVVWFIDARVAGSVVASVLHTARRSRIAKDPLWLATGSATAPTRVGVSSLSGKEPPRGPQAQRFAADLELYLGPVSVTGVAVPRARDDAPNESTLATEVPHERPVQLTADGSCRWSSDAMLRDVGAALCEIQGEPYGLRWVVDVDTPYPRLLERLVDDPRPPQCVGGPLVLRYSNDNPPSCQEAILMRDLLPRFAYEARQQREEESEGLEAP